MHEDQLLKKLKIKLFRKAYLFCEADLDFEMDDAFLLDAGIVERKSKCVIQNN
jgi:hypothetical protein